MVTNKEYQKKLKAANAKIKELKDKVTGPGIVSLKIGSVVMLPDCEEWAFKLGFIDHGKLDIPKLEFEKIEIPGEEPKE